MRTALYLILALLPPSSAIARGGQGTASDAGMLVAIAFLFAIAAIGAAVRKRYPGIPQTLGGILVLLMLGQFGAAILAGIGVISNSAIPWAGIAIAVAAPFAMVWWSDRKQK